MSQFDSNALLDEVSDTITAEFGNNDSKEITMYYGLLSEICTQVQYSAPDGDYLNIFSNPIFQTQILNALLCPRDEKGRPTSSDFSIESLSILPSEAEKLIAWARQHSFNFFMRTNLSMLNFARKNEKLMTMAQELETVKTNSIPSSDGTAA